MALRCYTLLHNTKKVNGQSPWEFTFGEEFEGERFPFGAFINFKPTSSRKLSTKFGPDAVTGAFAGYVTTSGEGWRRECLAWPLVGFKDVDLSIDCEMVPRHPREPIVAERISLVADKITFPLKNEYERVNATLEGVKDIASSREESEGLEMVDVESANPKLRYISKGYAHYSKELLEMAIFMLMMRGIMLSSKLGRRYRVRSDGVREVPTSRPLGIPSEARSRMSEREKEEAIRTRDVIDRKSKLRPAPKKGHFSVWESVVEAGAEGDGEFEGYSPDGPEGVAAPDPEAELVERYARESGSDTDEEAEIEPATPGVEIDFEPESDYAFHNDGFDVPVWEEIAAEGKKIDAVPCTPIFDTGERLAKDLFQRGRRTRKDIVCALRLASLKTRVNARTIDVAGQPAPKRLDTWGYLVCIKVVGSLGSLMTPSADRGWQG